MPSQEACLTCHATNVGSTWETTHKAFEAPGSDREGPGEQGMRSAATRPAAALAVRAVHWNQIEANTALYKMNIESAAFNDTGRPQGRR